jgi:hypothetical protein
MAITIEPKETKPPKGGHSYICIYGQVRDDLRTIAAHTSRTMQDVGLDLLKQAINEVMHQFTDPPDRPKLRGVTRVLRKRT